MAWAPAVPWAPAVTAGHRGHCHSEGFESSSPSTEVTVPERKGSMGTEVCLLDIPCSSTSQCQLPRETCRAGRWVWGTLTLGPYQPALSCLLARGPGTTDRTILHVNIVCVLASLLSPGPLPPPPPISRNGSTSRALPAAPQLPSRAGLENQRGGTRPPLPPDRPGSGAPPPPPPPSSALRNGFQDPGDGKPCYLLLVELCIAAFGLNRKKYLWERLCFYSKL